MAHPTRCTDRKSRAKVDREPLTAMGGRACQLGRLQGRFSLPNGLKGEPQERAAIEWIRLA